MMDEYPTLGGHVARPSSAVPPHPGPLPWGEGESYSSPTKNHTAGFARMALDESKDAVCYSLSPRERVRVRGKWTHKSPKGRSSVGAVEHAKHSGEGGTFRNIHANFEH